MTQSVQIELERMIDMLLNAKNEVENTWTKAKERMGLKKLGSYEQTLLCKIL